MPREHATLTDPPALERPALVNDLARRFGSQCVVVGIDSRGPAGRWRVHQYAGDPARTRDAGRDTLDWLVEVQRSARSSVLGLLARDTQIEFGHVHEDVVVLGASALLMEQQLGLGLAR